MRPHAQVSTRSDYCALLAGHSVSQDLLFTGLTGQTGSPERQREACSMHLTLKTHLIRISVPCTEFRFPAFMCHVVHSAMLRLYVRPSIHNCRSWTRPRTTRTIIVVRTQQALAPSSPSSWMQGWRVHRSTRPAPASSVAGFAGWPCDPIKRCYITLLL